MIWLFVSIASSIQFDYLQTDFLLFFESLKAKGVLADHIKAWRFAKLKLCQRGCLFMLEQNLLRDRITNAKEVQESHLEDLGIVF